MQGMEGVWNLLVQIPIVAAFMWFALEMLKRFERIQARQSEILMELQKVLEQMHRTMIEHDVRMRTLLGERWDGGGN